MSEVNKRGAGVRERQCCPGTRMGSGLSGAEGRDPSLWLEQPGEHWGGFVICCVCAGGGVVGENRDFSASHSSKHDINNSDYFWLPFLKVWSELTASAEASSGRVAPATWFLSWGAQPGLAAGCCVRL